MKQGNKQAQAVRHAEEEHTAPALSAHSTAPHEDKAAAAPATKTAHTTSARVGLGDAQRPSSLYIIGHGRHLQTSTS